MTRTHPGGNRITSRIVRTRPGRTRPGRTRPGRTRPQGTRPQGKSRFTEAGAALVEAALVLPLLALFIFATIDGSVYIKSYLSLGYATKAGARADITKANHPLADYELLQAVRKSKFGLDPDSIERIVVFKATSFDDSVPPACLSTDGSGQPQGVTGLCNVFNSADFDRPSSDFDESSEWGAAASWPAWLRQVSRSSNPDLVGVAIRARVSTPVGIFGHTSWNVTTVTIQQIEARSA